MRDPKLWTDLITAGWIIVMAALVDTPNTKSHVLFKVVPLVLGFLLAMSHAKVFF